MAGSAGRWIGGKLAGEGSNTQPLLEGTFGLLGATYGGTSAEQRAMAFARFKSALAGGETKNPAEIAAAETRETLKTDSVRGSFNEYVAREKNIQNTVAKIRSEHTEYLNANFPNLRKKVYLLGKDTISIKPSIQESFTDSYYVTAVTKETISFYRVFGGRGQINGSFVTTKPTINKIAAKIEAALLPGWGNTKQFEALVVVPKGTRISIGKVAPQTIPKAGTILKGGADQILLPYKWDENWVINIRELKP